MATTTTTTSETPSINKVTGLLGQTIVVNADQYIAVLEKGGIQMLTFSEKLSRGKYYQIISMARHTFNIKLEAKSKEMHPFSVETTWIAGPYLQNQLMFKKYMEKTGGAPMSSTRVTDLVTNVITGECRAILSSMTLREIVHSEAETKRRLISVVQRELDNFGIIIDNSNVKKICDFTGNKYIERLNKEAIEEEKRLDFKLESDTRQEMAYAESIAKKAELKAAKEIMEDNLEIEKGRAAINAAKEAEAYDREVMRRNDEANFQLQQLKALHEIKMKTELDEAEINLAVKQKHAEAMKITSEAEKLRIENLRTAMDQNVTLEQITEFQKLADGRYENMAKISVAAIAAAPQPTYVISKSKGAKNQPLLIENVKQTQISPEIPTVPSVGTPFQFPSSASSTLNSK
ncbi:hypothetical protein HK098_000507 [Nowakowskiella sp. JEL0407]|nr:hypothetical protein HK098_000507 [Nowakowskiella sp. JEL0407]